MDVNTNANSGCATFILGLMSFCAILISFFTLNEMKTQRQQALKPDLFLKNIDPLNLTADSICKTCVYPVEVFDANTNKALNDLFKLNFVNVGNGSAVNVEVTLDLDLEFYKSAVDRLNMDSNNFNLKIENNSLQFAFENKTGTTNALIHSKRSEQFSHILPATSNQDGHSFDLPDFLIQLHIGCIRSMWLSDGQTFENTHGILFEAIHKIKVTYDGIDGRSFEKVYEMVISDVIPNVNYSKNEQGVTTYGASWTDFIFYTQCNLIDD